MRHSEPSALSFSFPVGQSSRPAPRYRPGGAVDPASIGFVLEGLSPSDTVLVDGFGVTVRPGDAIALEPGRQTRVAVTSASGVMRSGRVALRTAPPRTVPVDSLPIVARTDGASIPSVGAGRVDFVGFEDGSVLYANGVRFDPFARDRANRIDAYHLPGGLTDVGVLRNGVLLRGTASIVPGDVFDILPTDLSRATERPWYLTEEEYRATTTTADPSPTPGPSPTAPPAPSPTVGITPSPTATQGGIAADAPGLLQVEANAPGTTITLNGESVDPRGAVAPGVYDLVASAPGYKPLRQWVTVYPGQKADVRLKLEAVRSIRPYVIGGLAVLTFMGLGAAVWRFARVNDDDDRRENPRRSGKRPAYDPKYPWLVSWDDSRTESGRDWSPMSSKRAAQDEVGYRTRQGRFHVKMEHDGPKQPRRGNAHIDPGSPTRTSDDGYVGERWDDLDELRKQGVGGLD